MESTLQTIEFTPNATPTAFTDDSPPPLQPATPYIFPPEEETFANENPKDHQFISTVMKPDVALKLSVEQLIRTLNKKLFMECTRVQSAIPPTSRDMVATLTREVRFQELKGNPEY